MIECKNITPYEIVIEVPRWGFVKRGCTDEIDFVSPIPCPYNYGSFPGFIGLDGDYLDAVVLGPRVPRGTHLRRYVYGVIGLTDRGMYDDKLICSDKPLTEFQRHCILAFFYCYAVFKRMLNFFRGRSGKTQCEGWGNVIDAFGRSRSPNHSSKKPLIGF